MARLPRLTLPGYPHHVIQRGNNRQPIFVDEGDFQFLLNLFAEHARAYSVAVHAYVLMGNHFHLLLTPATDKGVPQFMQAVGRRYVQYFNRRHQRTGTLWDGRYRSTIVQAEHFLLQCMAYIDLNPVRAGDVEQAADYPWSSYAHNVGVRQDRMLTPHPIYWGLGNTPFEREAAYAQLVQAGLHTDEQLQVTQSTLSGWALGEADFVATLQQQTLRRVAPGRPGRPSKKSKVFTG